MELVTYLSWHSLLLLFGKWAYSGLDRLEIDGINPLAQEMDF